MKSKFSKSWILIAILFFVIPSVITAKADDHDHYYKHKKHDDWDDWDDDDEWKKEYKSGKKRYQTGQQQTLQPSYWNIWTRDTNTSLNEDLPFQETKEVSIELNGKSTKLFVLPSNGQLLVSGEKMAAFLNIQHKLYSQSRILELSNGKEELIVRAGTNAAYENMVKTPMPTSALFYEKTVYLPISVISNAFGYSVNWNEEKSTFILEQFKK